MCIWSASLGDCSQTVLFPGFSWESLNWKMLLLTYGKDAISTPFPMPAQLLNA